MLRPFCPIKRGRAMASEWPEVSSPKGPGTCCHPWQSISFSSTHCIALFLHTWCLLRARVNLSRGKKPIIPWDASSVLSAIASGNLQVIQTTFPLPVSLLASQPCSSWEARPRCAWLETCPPAVTMPAFGRWMPANASAGARSQLLHLVLCTLP